jgi:protease II
MYWEPAKYVARLRTLKTNDTPLLLKIKMEPAGHGGASGRYDRMKDQAFRIRVAADAGGDYEVAGGRAILPAAAFQAARAG